MPSNDRLWLNKHQGSLPVRPEPSQNNPEGSICDLDLRPRVLRLQDGKLLAQSEVLKEQILTGAQRAGQQTEEKPQESEHIEVLAGETPCKVGQDGVFARYCTAKPLLQAMLDFLSQKRKMRSLLDFRAVQVPMARCNWKGL